MKKNIIIVMILFTVMVLTGCGKKANMDISTAERIATECQWQTEDAIDIASEDLQVWYDNLLEDLKTGAIPTKEIAPLDKKFRHVFHDEIAQNAYDSVCDMSKEIVNAIKKNGVDDFISNEDSIMESLCRNFDEYTDTLIENSYELKMKELMSTYNIIYTEEE